LEEYRYVIILQNYRDEFRKRGNFFPKIFFASHAALSPPVRYLRGRRGGYEGGTPPSKGMGPHLWRGGSQGHYLLPPFYYFCLRVEM